MLELGTLVLIHEDAGWLPEPTRIMEIHITTEGTYYSLFGCGIVRFNEEVLEVVQ